MGETLRIRHAWIAGANTSELFHFSATCYYFGQSLTDELGATAPPIGLIHTAWGGSMVEQWHVATYPPPPYCTHTGVAGFRMHHSSKLPYTTP